MLNAIEAKKYATNQGLSETYLFRKFVEEKIIDACQNNEEGNCLYIKWGHAHDTVSEDK